MVSAAKDLRNVLLAAAFYGGLFGARAPRTARRLLYLALAARCVALARRPPPPRWHTGTRWNAFLALYRSLAARKLPGFVPVACDTRFGATHAWQNRGSDSSAPVVVFFHAARSTSLIFADLATLPALFESHRLVLLDYVADAGLSIPHAAGGPKTSAEHAQWAREVFAALAIASADLVGFSYGSFVAAMVATECPDLVRSTVVLNSPAAVFSSLKPGYLLHALLPHVLPACLGFDHDWAWNSLSAPGYNYAEACPRDLHDLFQTTDAIEFEHQLPQLPVKFDDAGLARLAKSAERVVLTIAKAETVIDPLMAAARARQAGVEVVEIQDAGHISVVEQPDMFAALNAELLLAGSARTS